MIEQMHSFISWQYCVSSQSLLFYIVCNECRGGKLVCPAGFVTGSNEITCLSSILPSVIPASAIGD